jgi:hypothetical protein
MMNEDGFKGSGFQRWYLENVGAFPKKKGLSDIGAMKKSISEIRAGYPIMVFPEGQTSWDGETQPIYPGTEKIAKKLNIPLVVIRVEGNFVAHPWWADFGRKGQVSVIVKTVKIDEVKEKTADELRNEILDHIRNNDVKKTKNNKFTGKNLTSGMNNIIFLCPICSANEKLIFDENKITCRDCKKDFVFNANLYLENPENEVDNFYEWVKLQKKFVKDSLQNAVKDEVLCESNFVRLIQNDYKGRVTTLDIGKMKILKDKLLFLGDSATIEIAAEDITVPVFYQNNIIQLEYPKGELKFMFLNSPMMKTLYFLRELTGYSKTEKQGFFTQN